MMLKLGFTIFVAGALFTIWAFRADRRLSLAQSEEYGTGRILAGLAIAIAADLWSIRCGWMWKT